MKPRLTQNNRTLARRGIDGSEDNAGCFIDENSLERARQLGLDPEAFLARNDAWSLFQALQDLVVTGPTGTNVNDFRAIYVAAPESASALE